MAQLNFNANEVAPDTGVGDPLPDGWYNVMVDQSEVKPTSNNATTGNAFLAVRFNVMDGSHNGRKLFTNFSIRNQNPVAQEIAYKQLSALAHAVGVLMVQDSEQLHGIPLKVRVKVRKGSAKDKNDPSQGNYDDSNDITMYKNINEPTPGSAAAPAAPSAPGGFGGFAPPAPAPAAAPAAAAPGGFAPQPWGQPAAAPIAAPAPVAPPAFAPPPVAAPVAPPAPVAAPAAPAPAGPPGWSQDANGQWVQDPVAAPAPAPAPAAPAAPAAANPAAAQSLTPPWARQG